MGFTNEEHEWHEYQTIREIREIRCKKRTTEDAEDTEISVPSAPSDDKKEHRMKQMKRMLDSFVSLDDTRTTEDAEDTEISALSALSAVETKTLLTKKNKFTMKKIFSFLLMAVMLLAVGASVVSCSSDDGEPENNPPKEEYVAKESKFSDALKKYKVSGMEYHQYQYVGEFSLHSEARSGVDATDRWKIGMYIENDPGVNKWNGTYQLHQLWGTLYGFEKGFEVAKAYLGTDEDVVPVKGAWIKFTDLHKTDKYGNKTYTVELHIDEMKEKNGDYTRNINITFTGSLSGGILEY